MIELRQAAAALVVALLAGCAGGESADQSAALTTQSTAAKDGKAAVKASEKILAGKARLVLSRPGGLLYAGAGAQVAVNGQKITELWGGSSSTVDVTAGKAKITVDAAMYPGSWSEDITLAAGTAYEIEVAPRQGSAGTAVLFGAIGGAVEAQNNPKSGLFEWKLTSKVAAKPGA